MRVILALDPGTRNTGWAKIRSHYKGWKLLDSGVIQTPSIKSAFEQIYQIRELVRKNMEKKPQATELWIEGYTAFGAMKMSKAQYVLQGALYALYDSLVDQNEEKVRVVPPATWKPYIDAQKTDQLQFLNQVCRKKKTQHELDAIGLAEFAILEGLNYVGETR